MGNPCQVATQTDDIADIADTAEMASRLQECHTSYHNDSTREDRMRRKSRCTNLPRSFQFSLSTLLLILSIPNVSCQLQPRITASAAILPELEEATLLCEVDSTQIASAGQSPLTWSRAGGLPSNVNIVPSRQNIGGSIINYQSRLTFRPTALDNDISFTCTATLGSSTGTASYAPPVILIPDQPVITGPDSVDAFENKTWTCVSNGASYIAPNVYWRNGQGQALTTGVDKNSVIGIEPNSNIVYSITNRISIPLAAVLAQYTLVCTVVHEFGTYSRMEVATKTVDVFFPPQITKGGGDELYTTEGVRQPISCVITVSSPPATSVTWTKDGNPIDFSSGLYETVTVNNPSLIIKSVVRGDEGDYMCTVTNSKGSSSFPNPTTLIVRYTPVISYPGGTDFVGTVGASLTLPCPVDSVPLPTTIRWKRIVNGVTQILSIATNPRYSGGTAVNQNYGLTINPVEDGDEGTYFCEADNDVSTGVGPAITTIVNFPIQVNVSSKYYERNEGESVAMDCSFHPPDEVIAIHWMKDGSERVIGNYTLNDPTLVFEEVAPENATVYYCQVETASKEYRSEPVHLLVNYAPRVALLNEITYVRRPGESVVLRCPAMGHPALTYTWLRNDEVFDLSNSSQVTVTGRGEIITLLNLGPQDGANFRCVVSNSLGNATGQILRVDILLDPVATVDSSVQVLEGRDFTINCVILMFPVATSITWFKGNTQIDISGNPSKYSGGSVQTPSLTVRSAAKSDTGQYRCSGTNGADTISGTSDVTVTYLPKVSVPSSEILVNLGEAKTITCTVDASPQATSVVWRRHVVGAISSSASNIQIGGRYSGGSLSQPSLTISSVQSVDDATYYCVVTNSIGETVSSPVDLRIQYAPTNIQVNSVPAQLQAGQGFQLTCTGDAYPPITAYAWYRGNTKVADTSTYSVGQSTVLDYTQFSCRVTNPVGTVVSANIRPDVQFAPVRDGSGTRDVFGQVGQTVTLECLVNANPPANTFVWYKESNIIPGETSSQLTVTLNADGDYGSYSCSASNSIGQLNPAGEFTVIEGTPPGTGASTEDDSGLSTATIVLIVIICIIILIIIILLLLFCCVQGLLCFKGKENTKVAPTHPTAKSYNGSVMPFPAPSPTKQNGKVNVDDELTPRNRLPPLQASGAIISLPEKSGARAHHLPPLHDEETVNYYKEDRRRSRPKKKKSKKHENDEKTQLTGGDGSPKDESPTLQQGP